MLTFKQFILEYYQLLEDRIDFLKQNFEGKLNTEHDPYGEHKSTSDIVDHFANRADPTRNKSHTQWILRQYQQGNIRQEDFPRIHQALSDFERHKKKLENKDLGSYKTISDLEDAIEPHLGKEEPLSKRQESRKIKEEGSEIVHSSPNLSVRKLKTKEAACFYGAGTKWCTAGDENNMFDYYNFEGPLYIIHHKDESGDRKFQYHPVSDQFMDEKDRPIDIGKFVEKHPEMKDVKEFQGYHPDIPLTKENRKELERELHQSLDNDGSKSDSNIRDAAKRGYLLPEHINKHPRVNSYTLDVVARHTNDPEIQKSIIKHPKVDDSPDVNALGYIYEKSNDPEIHRLIAQNPKSRSYILKDMAEKTDEPELHKLVVQHPNTDGYTLGVIAKKTDDSEILREILKHPECFSGLKYLVNSKISRLTGSDTIQ